MSISERKTALLKGEELVFTNDHLPQFESHELAVHYNVPTNTWDLPYHMWFDGELRATYKTFAGVSKAMDDLIRRYNLLEKTPYFELTHRS
jgi:hypothetical protein